MFTHVVVALKNTETFQMKLVNSLVGIMNFCSKIGRTSFAKNLERIKMYFYVLILRIYAFVSDNASSTMDSILAQSFSLLFDCSILLAASLHRSFVLVSVSSKSMALIS